MKKRDINALIILGFFIMVFIILVAFQKPEQIPTITLPTGMIIASDFECIMPCNLVALNSSALNVEISNESFSGEKSLKLTKKLASTENDIFNFAAIPIFAEKLLPGIYTIKTKIKGSPGDIANIKILNADIPNEKTIILDGTWQELSLTFEIGPSSSVENEDIRIWLSTPTNTLYSADIDSFELARDAIIKPLNNSYFRVNETILFSVNSGYGKYNSTFYFGDGDIENATYGFIEHLYNQTGIYIVKVEVYNETQGKIIEKQIQLNIVEEMPIQEINIDFNNEIKQVSNLIFGQGIGAGSSMYVVLNSNCSIADYNQTFWQPLKEAGIKSLRFQTDYATSSDWLWYWENATGGFEKRCNRTNGSVFKSVDYWFGLDEWHEYAKNLAAEVVLTAYVNGSTNFELTPPIEYNTELLNYTNKQKNFSFIYWEMGNEEEGNSFWNGKINRTEYALAFNKYCKAMKELDNRIKCGFDADISGSTWPADKELDKILNISRNYTDFLIRHIYSPHATYEGVIIYAPNCKTFSGYVNTTNEYNISINILGSNASSCTNNPNPPCYNNPYPAVEFGVDNYYETFNITAWNTQNDSHLKNRVYTQAVNLEKGQHSFFICLINDYYNATLREDKNIIVARNLMITNSSGENFTIEIINKEDWTYSWFANTKEIEEKIKSTHLIANSIGLDLPLFVTEFNHYYEPTAPWGAYGNDWRSNLFLGLMFQSLIKEKVQLANLWAGVGGEDMWTMLNKTGGKWPIYYVFTLFSRHTGDILVNSEIISPLIYENLEFQNLPEHQDTEFLSVIASKSDENKKIYINIINRHQKENLTASINLQGVNIDDEAEIYTLRGESLESHPSRYSKDVKEVVTNSTSLHITNSFTYTFPSYSITVIEADYSEEAQPVIIQGGNGRDGIKKLCTENWTCEWTTCKNNVENLICKDLNSCNKTEIIKETRYCEENITQQPVPKPTPAEKPSVILKYLPYGVIGVIIVLIIIIFVLMKKRIRKHIREIKKHKKKE